jgi:hypothetical protein
MKNILFTVASVASLCALSTPAWAGGSSGSPGVGGEFQTSGLGGLSVNYDMGEFHVGGFLGYYDNEGDDNSIVELGARFYYHIHTTAMSDFGVGGSFGVGLFDNPAPADDTTALFIEPGFQIRAFVTSNVALSFTGGLSISASDSIGGAYDFALTSDFVGAGGVHYYFF